MSLDQKQAAQICRDVYQVIRENRINTVNMKWLLESKFRIHYSGQCVLPPTQKMLISSLDILKESGYIYKISKKAESFYSAVNPAKENEIGDITTDSDDDS